jgi:hypothetical protein
MAGASLHPRPRHDRFIATTTVFIIITTITFTTICTAEATRRRDADRTVGPTCWSTRGS